MRENDREAGFCREKRWKLESQREYEEIKEMKRMKRKKKQLVIVVPPILITILSRTMDLSSQFICQWVSSQSYRFYFKRSLDSPNSIIPVVPSPAPPYPFILLLSFSKPSPFRPLSFYFLSFFFFLLFLSFPRKTNPLLLSTLPPLYSLPLVGFKSLLFHQFPCNPTFIQNPQK